MRVKELWEMFLQSKGKDCGVTIFCDTESKAKQLLDYLYSLGFERKDKKEKYNYEYKSCYSSEIVSDTIRNRLEKKYNIISFEDIKQYL